jgi:hypothetical protein
MFAELRSTQKHNTLLHNAGNNDLLTLLYNHVSIFGALYRQAITAVIGRPHFRNPISITAVLGRLRFRTLKATRLSFILPYSEGEGPPLLQA